jgi:hypothetical protein
MEMLVQGIAEKAVYIACYVAMAIMLGMLLRAAQRGQPVADPWGGPLLFRYSALLRGISLALGFGPPLAISILFFLLPRKEGDEVWALIAMVLFIAIGLPLWWDATRFAVGVSPQGLDCRSPWRDAQFIAWGEIEAITYNPTYMWFLVRAMGGRTFRVSAFVSGISEFLARCEQHLPPTALDGAEAGYLAVGRPFPRG